MNAQGRARKVIVRILLIIGSLIIVGAAAFFATTSLTNKERGDRAADVVDSFVEAVNDRDAAQGVSLLGPKTKEKPYATFELQDLLVDFEQAGLSLIQSPDSAPVTNGTFYKKITEYRMELTASNARTILLVLKYQDDIWIVTDHLVSA